MRARDPEGRTGLGPGCGDGALLERLMRDLGVRGQGLEIDPEAVFSAWSVVCRSCRPTSTRGCAAS